MKKKTTWTRLLLLSGISALSAFYCSPTSPDNAGNSTQTGNGMVAGILFEPDGTTPARSAKVYLRKKNTLADTTGALLKRLATTADTVITDDSGKFVIDSVDTGIYVIEASDGSNNLAINDSVPVSDPDSTVTLPPDTLKPAGAIKGVIRLSEGGDPRKVFILAFGIDRFARVNTDGSFKFNVLAEGKYDLRLISSLDNYGVLDTVNISVISADTTDLDTIDLPFTGIPTPKNVTLAYDTLKQIVTLSWEKARPTLVNGYYVYRRNVDSNSVLARINTSLITDTLYHDSTGIQDQTYEYRVAAVDQNATEGTKSAGVNVKVVSGFTLIGSFGSAGTGDGQFNNPAGLSFDKGSFVFLADVQNNRVQKFDTNGNFVAAFGSFGSDSGKFKSPLDVSVDDSGFIFVVDHMNNRIQKFDRNFNLIAISDSGLNRPQTIVIDSKGNLYINEISSPKIKKLNRQLKITLEWGQSGSNNINALGSPQNLAIDSLDRIYIADNSLKKIAVFDTAGNFINAIYLDANGKEIFINPIDLSVQSNRIFVSDIGTKKILVFDLERNILAKWGDDEYYSLVALPNIEIWASVLSEQKVYRFRIKQ